MRPLPLFQSPIDLKDAFKTISTPGEGLYKEKGSKFIGKVAPVFTETEALEFIKKCRADFPDAVHHCFAWRLGVDGEQYRINDDGEPSGSAGKPIHGQLLSFDITNVVAVVIRYFGGTKLGVGGLINAYREATKDALVRVSIINGYITTRYQLIFDYDQTAEVNRLLEQFETKTIAQDFMAKCSVIFEVRERFENDLIDQLQRLGTIEKTAK